jgi:hypothetical protein
MHVGNPRGLGVLAVIAAALPAQGSALDVVDGETLYEGGRLLSFGVEIDREDTVRSGRERVADPSAAARWRMTTTVALQYGLRHDVQIGVALPYVVDEASSLLGDTTTAGVGDLELLAKWRFWRWDTRGASINTSLITSLSLPTGDDDATEGGVELEPEAQPGSGGFDPAIGIATTPEPGRWRFNAAVLWQARTDSDGDGDRLGSSWFAELAIGNRFWLEPYPGPFMRADVYLHWYDEDRDRMGGQRLADTGGQRLAVGAKWAFRPRPSLDFQVSGEVPVWRDANGVQLDDDWSLQFAFGYRF